MYDWFFEQNVSEITFWIFFGDLVQKIETIFFYLNKYIVGFSNFLYALL